MLQHGQALDVASPERATVAIKEGRRADEGHLPPEEIDGPMHGPDAITVADVEVGLLRLVLGDEMGELHINVRVGV
jgi:hypothetical protein